MKRVYARGGVAIVRDVPEPEIRKGEVLIKTAYSAISVGTEMWLIEGSADPTFTNHEYPPDPPRWPKTRSPIGRNYPLPRPPDPEAISLGYSLSGRVVDVHDQVTDLRAGDAVAASGSQCAHHAGVVAVPRSLVARVPAGLPLRDAALVTLGSVAVTALRETRCQFGERIVLYGLGLLGLLAAQVGKAAGFNLIGIEIDEGRLSLARSMGLEVINPNTTDPVRRVKDLTDGFGADAVILGLKTASSEAMNMAFDMCRQRARVVAQGLFGMEVERSRFYANQVELVPVIGYGLGRYDPVYEEGNTDYPIGLGRWTENRNQEYFLRLLVEGHVNSSLIAPVSVPIERAPEAYDIIRGPDRPPTVLLTYEGG